MKNMRNVSLFFVLLMFLAGCDKKKETDPTPDDGGGNGDTPKGIMFMHLHNYVEETEVDGYNIVYTTSEGRKISISKAQVYISDFEFVKLDGSVFSLPDKYILKVQDNQVYQLGQVPVGNYKAFRFKVGLKAATNAMVPSTSSTDLLNKPDMWFGGAAQPDGYVFLHFAGKIDTTAAANALESEMVPFQYRVGTNGQYKQVIMPDQNYSVVANQVEFQHIYIDYTKLLNGVVLNNEDNLLMASPSDNSTALGTLLKSNIGNIFIYE